MRYLRAFLYSPRRRHALLAENLCRPACGQRGSEAVLELRYRRIRVRPPIGKQKLHPARILTVLHATERDPPKGREPVDWKLVTDLPVRSRADAIEKLKWYAMRLKIETFHNILKSGFKAEEIRLRAAERIVNLLARPYE